MTENMVERVARALCRHEEKNCWETHVSDARAAIQVMREPTSDMHVAAGIMHEQGGAPIMPTPYQAWTRMIDAALKTV